MIKEGMKVKKVRPMTKKKLILKVGKDQLQ